jgi:hypothetical protein
MRRIPNKQILIHEIAAWEHDTSNLLDCKPGGLLASNVIVGALTVGPPDAIRLPISWSAVRGPTIMSRCSSYPMVIVVLPHYLLNCRASIH